MSYNVTQLNGASHPRLPVERFDELLDELEGADDEHTNVSVTHESEWNLSVFPSGLLVLEDLESGHHVHCGPVARPVVIALMTDIAFGRIAAVESALPWRPGYRSARDDPNHE